MNRATCCHCRAVGPVALMTGAISGSINIFLIVATIQHVVAPARATFLLAGTGSDRKLEETESFDWYTIRT